MTDQEYEARLAEIDARQAGATGGPWKADTYDYGEEYWFGGQVTDEPSGGESVVSPCGFIAGNDGNTQTVKDADFIAASRTDVPWLLAELRRCRDALRVAKREHGAVP